MRRWRKRLSRRGGVAIAAVAIVAAAGTGTVLADPGVLGSSDNPWPYSDIGQAPVLAAVGDISCQPGAKQGTEKATDICTGGATATARNAAQNATADQVEAMHPALVAVLGDEQYQNGYYQDFENSFDKYWGASKFLQRPAPGNHEFYDNHGQAGVRGYGYFDYYNGIQHNADGSEIDATVNTTTITNPNGTTGTTGVTQPVPQSYGQAGPFDSTGDGWYSYNLGKWHLISLNAECADEPGGCPVSITSAPPGTGSPWFNSETQWLAKDLAQNHEPCILAYWHQPTFSSTTPIDTPTSTVPSMKDSNESASTDAWWKLLYAYHATLILNGHEHAYARFAPMDPNGNADATNGIREFIVGTGGEGLDTVIPSTPNLQAWSDQYFGVMKLTLRPDGYDWDYESAMESPAAPAGTPPTYSDSGSGSCNGNGSPQNGQGNGN
jgi:acid phosphatase type 7